jgi:hypothetical protein
MIAFNLKKLIEDDGLDGNLFIGKIFQNAGWGGVSYVERVGMSGHFFVPGAMLGGIGKEIFVLGLSHLLTVDQSRGIPNFTLPSPK